MHSKFHHNPLNKNIDTPRLFQHIDVKCTDTVAYDSTQCVK